MAFVSAPNTAHFRVYQRLHDQRIENGVYFRAVAPFDSTLLTSVLTELLDQWEVEVLPHLASELKLVGGRGMALDSDISPAVDIALAAVQSGGQPDPALPGNCAFVVKFSSEARGRKSRGRVYVAGLPEGKVSGNQITEGQAANITSGVRTAVEAVELAYNVTQVIVSRTTDPATLFEVTQRSYTDRFVDSQRRRLTGRGL